MMIPVFENTNGKGRAVKASDYKYCFDRLCASDVNNKGYEFIKDRIAGAKVYHELTANNQYPPEGCSGIKVIDDYTIQIILLIFCPFHLPTYMRQRQLIIMAMICA